MIQSPAGYQGDVRIKRYLDFYRPGYGVAMLSSGVAFSPLSLFATGAPGVWYDPSDLMTMFQDVAGTTPVTAANQQVALVLDKSQNLLLGDELITPEANRDFSSDTGFWSKSPSGVSIAGGVAVFSNVPQFDGLFRNNFVAQQTYYEITFTLSSVTAGGIQIYMGGSRGTAVTAAGTYTQRICAGVTDTYLIFEASAANTSLNIDNVSLKAVGGTPATQFVNDSRPFLRQETDGRYYLAFDGSNDSFYTKSVNFSSTDKMSVVTGLRKLSDAVLFGIVAELSAVAGSTAGAFYVAAPGNSTNYAFYSRGTVGPGAPVYAAGFTAPVTTVVTALGDISAPSMIIRANGAQSAQSAVSQGTGNYGNYPLYIGRRNNATLPFNGRLYGLIVCGAALTAAQLTNTETWMNTKTQAY